MTFTEETQKDLIKLQNIQQQLQALMMQKQNLQIQLVDVENALKEMDNAKGAAYEIVGNIMVQKSPEDLKKSLKEKQELINLRVSSVDKQVDKLTKDSQEIQERVSKQVKPKGNA